MDEESEVSNRTQEKLVYDQKSPKELAVYDLIKNIARRGLDNSYKDLAFKWSNYKIVFEQVGAFDKTDGETTIKMLDGRILYRALDEGKKITHFRDGAWFEELRFFSEQITTKRILNEQEQIINAETCSKSDDKNDHMSFEEKLRSLEKLIDLMCFNDSDEAKQYFERFKNSFGYDYLRGTYYADKSDLLESICRILPYVSCLDPKETNYVLMLEYHLQEWSDMNDIDLQLDEEFEFLNSCEGALSGNGLDLWSVHFEDFEYFFITKEVDRAELEITLKLLDVYSNFHFV